ncbi:MAG: VWA domain-containing protein [Phycisphaerae bacterium]
MNEWTFDNPAWIHLSWVVLAIAGVMSFAIIQRRGALRRFAERPLLPFIAPPLQTVRPVMRVVLRVLVLGLLVTAILGPRWGEATEKVFKRNIDVMVCLDVSRSMLARDIAPNRLERAKLSIVDDLIPALAGDRVGVIAFAGVPRLVCPLTDDYGFLRLALNDVDIHSSPRGGSLIGDAIRKAVELFPTTLDTHKIILLITDGEDQESFPVQAAQAAWEEHKIPVIAVALGDEREGARIPLPGARGGETYLEYEGQTVWSKANFDDLRKVAAASGLNAFVPVGTKNFDLGKIYSTQVVPAIRYTEREEAEQVKLPAQFHWFAGAALLLVLIDACLREGKRPEARFAQRYRSNAA